MDSSCLNKAHLQHRCADSHLKNKKFEDAIECHKKAACLLDKALFVTENQRSLESIRLQRDYHLRQKDIILVKKEQYQIERTKKDELRRRYADKFCNNDYEEVQGNDCKHLQEHIYRKMEETDSLLSILLKKSSAPSSDCESLKSFSDTDDRAASIDTIDSPNCNGMYTKHPKDDKTVIEELKILNRQLNVLIFELMKKVEKSNNEVDKLKERIQQLENDKGSKEPTVNNNNTNNLQVITDSSGGTSPFVFSPCSEISPDVPRILPVLAPLEMPTFDFTNFMKTNGTN